MTRSVLCPPNLQLLSDNVIGVVTQRNNRRQNMNRVETPAQCQYGLKMDETMPRTNAEASPPTVQPKRVSVIASTTRQRSNQDEFKIKLNSMYIRKNQDLAGLVELLRISEAMRRKKNRELQKNYRKRQVEYLAKLENDIRLLKKAIRQLNCSWHSLSGHPKVKRDVWNVAVEYYACFSEDLKRSTEDMRRQLDFVKATTTPDVVFNGGFGPDNLVTSCRVLEWFDHVEVDLQRLVMVSTDWLTMETRISATISARTLRKLFPHLSKSGKSDDLVGAKLAAKLVNQRIVTDARTLFQWDSSNLSITSVTAEIDLMMPFLRILGSLEDVSVVFEDALVSPAFF